jgi:hypothetical protein
VGVELRGCFDIRVLVKEGREDLLCLVVWFKKFGKGLGMCYTSFF